jgi:S-DNA-T family DNA segregation ATPase FtsK/SpoIIIE
MNTLITLVCTVALLGVLVVPVYVVTKAVIWTVRFALADSATRRHYPMAFRAWVRWRWLTRNVGLAWVDQHSKSKSRRAFGPTIGKNVRVETTGSKIWYPKVVKVRPDPFGVVLTVKTIPKIGRREFEDKADHLANYWRSARVQTSQPRPGRLIVRALRRDPLAEPLEMADVPASVYSEPNPLRPYLGRDEWGVERYLELSGITGITAAGLPRYGKTSLIVSLLIQMFGSDCVQFVFIDGKGGEDYTDFRDRAWLTCGDDLEEAADVSGRVHEEMRRRQGQVVSLTGSKNAWHRGPTADFPLIVTIWDECHTYFDLEGVKGDKEAERLVRQCRTNAAQMVKKGGAVLFLNVFITQKQTSDAIPTAIRDNCGVGLSFAVKTRDAAIAGLGEAIREYPSYCPTGLRERPTYIGVCTASLPGSDPFVRLRVPNVSEEEAAGRAALTAHLLRDPTLPTVRPVPEYEVA